MKGIFDLFWLTDYVGNSLEGEYEYFLWDVGSIGLLPSAEAMQNISTLIWNGGAFATLGIGNDSAEVNLLTDFVANGGNLGILAQDYLGAYYSFDAAVDIPDWSFFNQVMGVTKVFNDVADTMMNGVANDPITGDAIFTDMIFDPTGLLGYTNYSDRIEHAEDAIPIITGVGLADTAGTPVTSNVVGVRRDFSATGGGKVVFLAADPIGWYQMTTDTTDNWAEPNGAFLRNMMEWFGAVGVAIDEEARIVPEAFALRQNFPNPFNPVTTFPFDLPTDNDVTVGDIQPAGTKGYLAGK
ncbi:MAG: hypothetical protein IIA61_11960 [Candidatus Marinimicrobia bacterium]|nr:hypothetical protein [Candidatus Neomarinimicrobiota bacterium]